MSTLRPPLSHDTYIDSISTSTSLSSPLTPSLWSLMKTGKGSPVKSAFPFPPFTSYHFKHSFVSRVHHQWTFLSAWRCSGTSLFASFLHTVCIKIPTLHESSHNLWFSSDDLWFSCLQGLQWLITQICPWLVYNSSIMNSVCSNCCKILIYFEEADTTACRPNQRQRQQMTAGLPAFFFLLFGLSKMVSHFRQQRPQLSSSWNCIVFPGGRVLYFLQSVPAWEANQTWLEEGGIYYHS